MHASLNGRSLALLSVSFCGVAACARSSQELSPAHTHPAPALSVYGARVSAATLSASADAAVTRPDAGGVDKKPADVTPPSVPRASVRLGRFRETEGNTVSRTFPGMYYTWSLINHVNWQAADAKLAPLPPEPGRLSPGECPAGMQLAKGNFLVDSHGREDTDDVLLAQNATCSAWRGEKGMYGVCEQFDERAWTTAKIRFQHKQVAVCIDRYEFPNRYGEFPLIVTTFGESQNYCAKEGKRLCTESEWTFACEGEEAQPYPYGYARDAALCRIDISGPGNDEDTFNPRTTKHTAEGLDRAWRALRSGERSGCVSVFGVHDLSGNVDEWTSSVRTGGYRSILKGGYWGQVRARCRPQTRAHGPLFVTYEQGFRCCKDPSLPSTK